MTCKEVNLLGMVKEHKHLPFSPGNPPSPEGPGSPVSPFLEIISISPSYPRGPLAPLDIKYKCLICKNNFSSEAKIFNSLEYKALKICIKDAIISKIKAKPKFFGCGCNNDIKKIKFIHRKYCRGELFLGELHGKKVVVCNKCDSIGNYENYIWTCPLCYKKFKDIEKEENLNKDINIEKNANKETSLERKNSNNKMVRKGSIVPKTSIKSILLSLFSTKGHM